MKIFSKILLVIVVLFFSACYNKPQQQFVSPYYSDKYFTPKYIFNLEHSSPKKPNSRIDKDNLIFEDEKVLITFTVKHKYLAIKILNKTNESIKLIWDDIIYVDYEGLSQGVIHNGTRYFDKDLPQKTTNIAPKSFISDIIVPKNKVVYLYDEWFVRDLLSLYGKDDGTFNSITEKESIARGSLFVNKKINIILPIQIKNKIDEYHFNFLVKNFEVVEYNEADY